MEGLAPGLARGATANSPCQPTMSANGDRIAVALTAENRLQLRWVGEPVVCHREDRPRTDSAKTVPSD
jgi:hypothetical protein